MYYLRIINETEFGFVVDGIHSILPSDIAISDDDHRTFLERQQTERFRLKNQLPSSGGLFDYIEAYMPDVINGPTELTEAQQLQLALAEAIEKQEADKLELQLAMAEFIESQVTEKGGV